MNTFNNNNSNTSNNPNQGSFDETTPSSIASSSLSSAMFYPNTCSGVDKLIMAANFCQNSSPFATPSSYATFNMAYYQQLQRIQQQQQQQQQHIQQQQQPFYQPQQIFQEQPPRANLTTLMPPPSLAGYQAPESSVRGQAPPPAHSQPRQGDNAHQPTPRNKHELELFNLLRQANLLEYFGRFIKYGGDDVQQLADADEQEFLEIMQFVEMNNKPLHIRRMQKALQKWREESGKLNQYTGLDDYIKPVGIFDNYDDQFNTSLSSIGDTRSSRARTSGASRALFPEENDNKRSSNHLDSPLSFCTPHVIIKNAPKKPRLMDSIVPSDLTKGIQPIVSPTKSFARDAELQDLDLTPPPNRGRGSRKYPGPSSQSPPDSPKSPQYHEMRPRNTQAQEQVYNANFSPISPRNDQSPKLQCYSSGSARSSLVRVSDESDNSDLVIESGVPSERRARNKRKRASRKMSEEEIKKYYNLVGPNVTTASGALAASSAASTSQGPKLDQN